MRKAYIIYLGLILFCLVSCRSSKDDNSINQGKITISSGAKHQDQDTMPAKITLKENENEKPRDFSIDFLESLVSTTGWLCIPNKSIWDIDEYKKYEHYFPLTEPEIRIAGAWRSVDPDSGAGVNAEQFFFYPNKIANVEYGAGYGIGLWKIEGGILSVEIHGFCYPDEKSYTKRQVTPYTVEICRIEDISPMGYSRRKFANVPIPESIANKADGALASDLAYHFKTLVVFDGGSGIHYDFMYPIERIIKEGNPSVEDIVTLKDARYIELW